MPPDPQVGMSQNIAAYSSDCAARHLHSTTRRVGVPPEYTTLLQVYGTNLWQTGQLQRSAIFLTPPDWCLLKHPQGCLQLISCHDRHSALKHQGQMEKSSDRHSYPHHTCCAALLHHPAAALAAATALGYIQCFIKMAWQQTQTRCVHGNVKSKSQTPTVHSQVALHVFSQAAAGQHTRNSHPCSDSASCCCIHETYRHTGIATVQRLPIPADAMPAMAIIHRSPHSPVSLPCILPHCCSLRSAPHCHYRRHYRCCCCPCRRC